MKCIVTLVIALMLSMNSIEAQNAEVSFHAQTHLEESSQGEPVFDTPQFYLQGYDGGRVGYWFFLFIEPMKRTDFPYFSFVVGPYYSITRFFEVSVGGGVEQIGDTLRGDPRYFWRGAVSARLGTLGSDDLFVEGYYENGESGESWAQAQLIVRSTYKPATWLGVMHQTGFGTGPVAKVKAPLVPIRLWVAPWMNGAGSTKRVMGVELYFSK